MNQKEKQPQTKQTRSQGFFTNLKMLKEIYILIVKNKKWWLLPIFLVFAFFSFFMVLVGGSSILPAIYALF